MKTPDIMTALKVRFVQAQACHQDIIFKWLAEPHMQEFWDNSQEQKDDIINFINGRVQPSVYFNGIFTYWIGMVNEDPYCLIMTAEFIPGDEEPALWNEHASTTGQTYTLDFGIGNTTYLGKGLAAPTLIAFTNFFHDEVNKKADTFFIDPNANNPRAQRVYAKAGFELVGEFNHEGEYWDFGEKIVYLMVKKYT